jgi:feruloyl esterase
MSPIMILISTKVAAYINRYYSLHTGTVSGKLLTQKFYGSSLQKSYYLGCSLGGRQGIKAAEKYPEDFDGIVAGSPAVDFNDLNSWRAHFYPITGAIGSTNFINATTWTNVIHPEILNQCDAIDGVTDGIIEVPSLCAFKPEKILCSTTLTTNCLNSAQVAQVKKIFSPFTKPNGDLIFPAMQPGSEIMAVTKLYAGAPFSYSLVSCHSPHMRRHKLTIHLLGLLQIRDL